MSDRDQESLHQVKGLVFGANWRATKFVSPVPTQHTCSMCRVISRKTFLLPCFHTLCGSCRHQCAEEGICACPLDGAPFDDKQCQKIQLGANAVGNLQARCWNEDQGCPFVGTLQDILTHYEQQCTFHAVACPGCSERVLQQDLPVHYRTGCGEGAIRSPSENATLQHGLALNVEEIRTSLEELKALIREPYQDQLPALQSGMNDLLEQTRNHGAQIKAIDRELRDCEIRIHGHFAQDLSRLSAILSQQFGSQQETLCTLLKHNAEREERSSTEVGRMPWSLEKRHILRKLELMVSESQSFMHLLQQSVDKSLERAVLEYKATFSHPNFGMQFHMSPPLGKWESNEDGYIITVSNVNDVLQVFGKVIAFTRWYRRDKYLQVAIGNGTLAARFLSVFLKWGTTAQNTRPEHHYLVVCVRHREYPEVEDYLMDAEGDVLYSSEILGFQQEFRSPVCALERYGLIHEGKLTFVLSTPK